MLKPPVGSALIFNARQANGRLLAAVTATAPANTASDAVYSTLVRTTPITGLTPLIVDVLANDTDADGDALTITSVDFPGTIASNKVRFTTLTPGIYYFDYSISDGHGGTDTSYIRIDFSLCGQSCQWFALSADLGAWTPP